MKEKLEHYAKETALFVPVLVAFNNLLSLYRAIDTNKEPHTVKTVQLIDASSSCSLASNLVG